MILPRESLLRCSAYQAILVPELPSHSVPWGQHSNSRVPLKAVHLCRMAMWEKEKVSPTANLAVVRMVNLHVQDLFATPNVGSEVESKFHMDGQELTQVTSIATMTAHVQMELLHVPQANLVLTFHAHLQEAKWWKMVGKGGTLVPTGAMEAALVIKAISRGVTHHRFLTVLLLAPLKIHLIAMALHP